MFPILTPTEIKRRVGTTNKPLPRNEEGLEISWADGSTSFIPSKLLRENCPCASCLESRGDTSHAKPLSGGRSSLRVLAATADEETFLEAVWPIGNYAIGIRWGDKHDSGIFTYKHLHELVLKTK